MLLHRTESYSTINISLNISTVLALPFIFLKFSSKQSYLTAYSSCLHPNLPHLLSRDCQLEYGVQIEVYTIAIN